ncbi:TIR domain-containing protein [Amycolatopsis sp. NPDC051102]|uniref:TIR domain-containing protein n=1 Tax=Amycolatopsis sp. NPDC051102 TaxID=3155163 RepID=UPI0034123EA3
MTGLTGELKAIATAARELADSESELDDTALSELEKAVEVVARAWSNSNLGYQSNVYYKGFEAPPAGHVFSREWGFLGTFHGSIGEWRPYQESEVISFIEKKAGGPNLEPLQAASATLRSPVQTLIERAKSVAARVRQPHDSYLTENVEELKSISLPSVSQLAELQMNISVGRFAVRDMNALEGGWQPSGHQKVLASVMYIRSPYKVASQIADVCERLGRHLEVVNSADEAILVQLGRNVFIGHGGASSEYLKLGVWLTELGIEWDVFDGKPTAGLSTKERISEMLDNANIAFLFMTPEDEMANGKTQARSNVIHEVGLFQGRLGFTKAIVLLEEGCEEFSNIEGLGQIRYPRGNVKAAFDEIRQVMRRERLLD